MVLAKTQIAMERARLQMGRLVAFVVVLVSALFVKGQGKCPVDSRTRTVFYSA